MHFAGTVGTGNGLIGLSGTFSKTAAPSGGIVESDAVTVGVPGASDGKITVGSRLDSGTVKLEFEKNASGSWVDESALNTVVFATGDTVKARIRNASAGESSTFTVVQAVNGFVLKADQVLLAS